MAQFRQSSAQIYRGGRFADPTFLIRDGNDFHSGLRIFPVRDLSDDVAGGWKRKLNFSNFRFGISAVALGD